MNKQDEMRTTKRCRKIKLTIEETAQISITKTAYSFGAIKEDARIRVEQDTDLVIQAIKRNLIFEENDKHLLETDLKAKRLLLHEDRRQLLQTQPDR